MTVQRFGYAFFDVLECVGRTREPLGELRAFSLLSVSHCPCRNTMKLAGINRRSRLEDRT